MLEGIPSSEVLLRADSSTFGEVTGALPLDTEDGVETKREGLESELDEEL